MPRNIIFDFGDVFINLDKAATARVLSQLGIAELSMEMLEAFTAYEKGLLSTETFIARGLDWVPRASKEQLVNAWNAILLDFPEYRLEFLEYMARTNKYRLFLLSNTNELHINRVKEKMGNAMYTRFTSCFEAYYYSHEIKMRKPDAEIFQFVLDTHGLAPGETLFIDDTLEHISTANSLGIQTWHLQAGAEDVVDLKINDR